MDEKKTYNMIDDFRLWLFNEIIKQKTEEDGDIAVSEWLKESFGLNNSELTMLGLCAVYDEENEDCGTDDGEREYRSILNEQANKWNAEVNRK